MTHFKRPPVPSTLQFVEEAPIGKLQTGSRAVVELVGYPDGQFRLTSSRIEGSPGNRKITQGPFSMFVDVDEARSCSPAAA